MLVPLLVYDETTPADEAGSECAWFVLITVIASIPSTPSDTI